MEHGQQTITRPPRRRPSGSRPVHHHEISHELEAANWTRLVTRNTNTNTTYWVHPNGAEVGVSINPVIQPDEAATIRATIQAQGD